MTFLRRLLDRDTEGAARTSRRPPPDEDPRLWGYALALIVIFAAALVILALTIPPGGVPPAGATPLT
jgi:hypothetical protein